MNERSIIPSLPIRSQYLPKAELSLSRLLGQYGARNSEQIAKNRHIMS